MEMVPGAVGAWSRKEEALLSIPGLLVAVLVALHPVVALEAPTKQVDARGPLQVGAAAPPFALPGPESGVISLREELRRGPLLLCFWASWCQPCKAGLRRVETWTAARAGQARSLPRILCLNYADDRERGLALWRELGLSLPVAWDRYGAVGERYGLKEDGASLPLTVFIGQDGLLRALIVSEGPDLPHLLDRLMAEEEERRGPPAPGASPDAGRRP
jgi:peroxiredoxin